MRLTDKLGSSTLSKGLLIAGLSLGGLAVSTTDAHAQKAVSQPDFYNCDGTDTVMGTADDDCRPQKGSPLIDAVTAAGTTDQYDINGDGNTSEVLPGAFRTISRNKGSSADQGYAESSGSALPVEMASTSATYNTGDLDNLDDDNVHLSWTTASETNNAGFNVQQYDTRSDSWDTISHVGGHGTTNEPQTYDIVDSNPFETVSPDHTDKLKYRIKQVDLDGTTSHSEPITVEPRTLNQTLIDAPSPNPVRTTATFDYNVPEDQGRAQVAVYDVLGRQVKTKTLDEGRGEARLNTSGLSSGRYFMRVIGDGPTTDEESFTKIQ